MDRRLNSFLDNMTAQHHDGNFVIVRNAGANYKGLEESISSIVNEQKIRKILWYTHDNCGACATVYKAFKHEIEVSHEVSEILVDQFNIRRGTFANPGEVESMNII